MLARFAAVLLVWFIAAGAAAPANIPPAIDAAIQQVSVAELKEYIAVLASDRLFGRGVCTPSRPRSQSRGDLVRAAPA
jgi:hypothetical protein